MQISSMFLRNITCIDHAVIDKRGLIFGGSYHLNAIVTGEVDEHEQVVVDFSTVKKQIKAIIDDNENGFDHKLWIIDDYSIAEIIPMSDGYVFIKTPHFSLRVPSNAIKRFGEETTRESGWLGDRFNIKSRKTAAIQKQLEEELNRLNNTTSIRVEVELTQKVFGSNPVIFTYFHGLKNSTSWGCNNIAHGHTSFVEVEDDQGVRLSEMEKMIAFYLNSAMLVFSENIEAASGIISYTTPRGKFELSCSDTPKKIIIDKETTIENIVEHVCEVLAVPLEFAGAYKVFISEGLQKGAVKLLYHK